MCIINPTSFSLKVSQVLNQIQGEQTIEKAAKEMHVCFKTIIVPDPEPWLTHGHDLHTILDSYMSGNKSDHFKPLMFWFSTAKKKQKKKKIFVH